MAFSENGAAIIDSLIEITTDHLLILLLLQFRIVIRQLTSRAINRNATTTRGSLNLLATKNFNLS